MSAYPSESHLWPAQTPRPSPSRPIISPSPSSSSSSSTHPRSKRRRRDSPSGPVDRLPHGSFISRYPRQLADAADVAEAKQQCQLNSGNDIVSCFPTDDTTIPQHQWATFVWNSRRPQITQTNEVDIFLFHADSLQQVLHFPNVTNPTDQAGSITAQVNDSWWGSRGNSWDGRNVSFTFYWLLTRSDQPLDGSQLPQSTFTAVQTTFADSVIASMASTSAAAASASSASSASAASAASASSASLSSVSAASRTATQGKSAPSSSSTGSVQSASGGSPFQHWAIAVIVVLGFLAIVASCILFFLILRRIRRRAAFDSANRNSMGSASPMMENAQSPAGPQSPLLGTGLIAGGAAAIPTSHRPPSVVSPDGASTTSHANPRDPGLISNQDAALMADAFRKALRKPEFAVEEGDSPEAHEEKNEELMNRELAEEGRDIRSVGSSRGVRVETLSDSGDTVQDHPR